MDIQEQTQEQYSVAVIVEAIQTIRSLQNNYIADCPVPNKVVIKNSDDTINKLQGLISNAPNWNYQNIIGYRIDTNQFKCDTIKNEIEAINAILEVVELYDESMLNIIKLNGKTFTSYTYHHKNNLKDNKSLMDFILEMKK